MNFFFFKARFIATICQNFNRELLLDSMEFFVSPFFSSSVWPHDPWCQLCKLRISMFKAVVDMSHIISVVRDETFITLGSSYYTCAFHKFHWQEIRIPEANLAEEATKHLASLGGIFRGVIFSHISSLTWDQDMCHLYQSVNKAKGKLENCG